MMPHEQNLRGILLNFFTVARTSVLYETPHGIICLYGKIMLRVNGSNLYEVGSGAVLAAAEMKLPQAADRYPL